MLVNPNASLDDSTSVSKKQALEIGGRCYLRGTRCGPDLPSAWRDLALNYHARSTLEEEGEEREKLSERAMSAARKCLALQPKSVEAWNLLGLLAINCDK